MSKTTVTVTYLAELLVVCPHPVTTHMNPSGSCHPTCAIHAGWTCSPNRVLFLSFKTRKKFKGFGQLSKNETLPETSWCFDPWSWDFTPELWKIIALRNLKLRLGISEVKSRLVIERMIEDSFNSVLLSFWIVLKDNSRIALEIHSSLTNIFPFLSWIPAMIKSPL